MFYTLLKVQRFFEAGYHTLISLLRIVLRFRYRNQVPKQQGDNSQLVILANGPSLTQSLLLLAEELDSQALMAVNQFVLSKEYEQFQPGHYTLLDIGFFLDQTILRVQEIRNQLIEAFIQKTSWPLTLYLPKEGKGSRLHKSLAESGKPFSFVFFNRTNIEGYRWFRHWAYRRNLGMPKPQNVLVGCLMLALVMRYAKIEIYGADHSWLENIRIGTNNELLSIEKHFYDKDKRGVPTRREHPETLSRSHLHDYLHDLARTFASYHLIQDFAKSLGIEVVNASQVSYIDAFERRR